MKAGMVSDLLSDGGFEVVGDVHVATPAAGRS